MEHVKRLQALDVAAILNDNVVLRDTLDAITSPLHIDGENHLAAVQHAREVLKTTIRVENVDDVLLEKLDACDESYRAVVAEHAEVEARLTAERNALRKAGQALYDAGRWSCDRPVAEAELWEDLRDALELPHGYATSRGVAALATKEESDAL